MKTVFKKMIKFMALIAIALITGCGGGGNRGAIVSETGLSAEQLQVLYQAAIEDARIAEADEIYRNLVAINSQNTDLSWSGEAGASDVLVVTWTSWGGYSTGAWNMGDYNAWVTVVPQARDFCSSYSGDYILRMEQLMGLPPNGGRTYFVEMWVSPDDLFRPSADPEITDHEAEIDFPYHADNDHKTWINNLIASMYGEDGYPWTRLGYTYDWGNQSSEVGLSEFVIKKNADVTISNIYLNSEYCGRQ